MVFYMISKEPILILSSWNHGRVQGGGLQVVRVQYHDNNDTSPFDVFFRFLWKSDTMINAYIVSNDLTTT